MLLVFICLVTFAQAQEAQKPPEQEPEAQPGTPAEEKIVWLKSVDEGLKEAGEKGLKVVALFSSPSG